MLKLEDVRCILILFSERPNAKTQTDHENEMWEEGGLERGRQSGGGREGERKLVRRRKREIGMR